MKISDEVRWLDIVFGHFSFIFPATPATLRAICDTQCRCLSVTPVQSDGMTNPRLQDAAELAKPIEFKYKNEKGDLKKEKRVVERCTGQRRESPEKKKIQQYAPIHHSSVTPLALLHHPPITPPTLLQHSSSAPPALLHRSSRVARYLSLPRTVAPSQVRGQVAQQGDRLEHLVQQGRAGQVSQALREDAPDHRRTATSTSFGPPSLRSLPQLPQRRRNA